MQYDEFDDEEEEGSRILEKLLFYFVCLHTTCFTWWCWFSASIWSTHRSQRQHKKEEISNQILFSCFFFSFFFGTQNTRNCKRNEWIHLSLHSDWLQSGRFFFFIFSSSLFWKANCKLWSNNVRIKRNTLSRGIKRNGKTKRKKKKGKSVLICRYWNFMNALQSHVEQKRKYSAQHFILLQI